MGTHIDVLGKGGKGRGGSMGCYRRGGTGRPERSVPHLREALLNGRVVHPGRKETQREEILMETIGTDRARCARKAWIGKQAHAFPKGWGTCTGLGGMAASYTDEPLMYGNIEARLGTHQDSALSHRRHGHEMLCIARPVGARSSPASPWLAPQRPHRCPRRHTSGSRASSSAWGHGRGA